MVGSKITGAVRFPLPVGTFVFFALDVKNGLDLKNYTLLVFFILIGRNSNPSFRAKISNLLSIQNIFKSEKYLIERGCS